MVRERVGYQYNAFSMGHRAGKAVFLLGIRRRKDQMNNWIPEEVSAWS